MQTRFTIELFKMKQAVRSDLLDALVRTDLWLTGHPAIQTMHEKISRRRCFLDCVICKNHDLAPTVLNGIYDTDKFIGWHCDDHKDQFHEIQESGRNCCEARISSNDSSISNLD